MSTLATCRGELKTFCFGLMLAMVGLEAGLALATTTAPPAPSPPAKTKVRRDRYDDPLPPGAVMRLGTVRYRVPEEIESLALSPDGKTVAVSLRASVMLFDASSGKRIKRLPAAYRPIFSPDGKCLAGVSEAIIGDSKGEHGIKSVVRVWELNSGQKLRDYDAKNMWTGWVGRPGAS